MNNSNEMYLMTKNKTLVGNMCEVVTETLRKTGKKHHKMQTRLTLKSKT